MQHWINANVLIDITYAKHIEICVLRNENMNIDIK